MAHNSLNDAISHSKLSEDQITQANRARRDTRLSQPKRLMPHLPPALPPLALLPKEEGGQGLMPHPTLRNLYVDGSDPDGIVYTSHGVPAYYDVERKTAEPECDKCLDAGFMLMKPPAGRSAGPWDGQRVVCRH